MHSNDNNKITSLPVISNYLNNLIYEYDYWVAYECPPLHIPETYTAYDCD